MAAGKDVGQVKVFSQGVLGSPAGGTEQDEHAARLAV